MEFKYNQAALLDAHISKQVPMYEFAESVYIINEEKLATQPIWVQEEIKKCRITE